MIKFHLIKMIATVSLYLFFSISFMPYSLFPPISPLSRYSLHFSPSMLYFDVLMRSFITPNGSNLPMLCSPLPQIKKYISFESGQNWFCICSLPTSCHLRSQNPIFYILHSVRRIVALITMLQIRACTLFLYGSSCILKFIP